MDFFEQPSSMRVSRHTMLISALVDIATTVFIVIVHFLRYTRSNISSASLFYASAPLFFHLLSAPMSLTVGLIAIDRNFVKAAGYAITAALAADIVMVIVRFTNRPEETAWFLLMADIGACVWLGASAALFSGFLITYRDLNWWRDDITNALPAALGSNVKADDVWRLPEVVGATRVIMAKLWRAEMTLSLMLILMLVAGLNAHTTTAKLTLLSVPHLIIPFLSRAVAGPVGGPIPEPGITNPRATVFIAARVLVVVGIIADGLSAAARTYLLIVGFENIDFGEPVFAQVGSVLSVIAASVGTSIVYAHLLIGAAHHQLMARLRKSLAVHMVARYESIIKPAVIATAAQLEQNKREMYQMTGKEDEGEWKDKVL